MIIAWFSAGITSAVATKFALSMYDDVEIFYIDIKSQHSDNKRFIEECENWYGRKINIISNNKGYKDQFDVIQKTKYINGPMGARCTLELKKQTRYELESELNPTAQIFGFEFSKKEINRAIRFKEQYAYTNPVFPLIEKKLTKEECYSLLNQVGISEPKMYKLGYNNNNCIGCVKGKKGYWNKIRIDFPDVFKKMAILERSVGRSCMKIDLKTGGSEQLFLDELKPGEGILNPLIPDCGMFCQLELEKLISKKAEQIMNGELSILDA